MTPAREMTPAETARLDRTARILRFIAVPVVLTSLYVFVQAFMAWRAGMEGWRPGANVGLMMGSATSISLVASLLLILRGLRDRSTPESWRRYVVPYALILFAFVLLALRVGRSI